GTAAALALVEVEANDGVRPLPELLDDDDPAPVVEGPDRLLDLSRAEIGEVPDVVGITLPVHVGELGTGVPGELLGVPAARTDGGELPVVADGADHRGPGHR